MHAPGSLARESGAHRLSGQPTDRDPSMTMAYEAASVVAMPAEAYGPAADAILSGARPILAQARRGFLQEFFDDAPGIPVSLRDAARGTLQCLQGRMDVHLRQLLEPGSTPEHVVSVPTPI